MADSAQMRGDCVRFGQVWNKVLSETGLSFKKGLTSETLLKTLRWLFIEQDVTYWNYDGRMMLWGGLQEEFE